MCRTICLASASQSRRKLLSQAKLNFIVQPANIDETVQNENPIDYVVRLAIEKANHVINSTQAEIIIGADSIALFAGKILGKPKSKSEAISMISMLQGQCHEFITGFCVIDRTTRKQISGQSISRINLIKMDNQQINNYVKKFKPYSFAGGYSITNTDWLVESISGSISNIQGLPMAKVKKSVEEFGYDWFDFLLIE